MLFNSIEYLLFLPVVVGLFYLLDGSRSRQRLILVASYLFYAAWDWRFLSLIVISTVVDFVVAKQLMDPAKSNAVRRRLVAVSIVVNLGILSVFKYFDFFVTSAAALLGEMRLVPNVRFLAVALPVGISFYTFQTLSYTIDVYRRRFDAESDLLTFAIFVSFFPQLVAGPIERARTLLPQLRNLNNSSGAGFASGLRLIGLGLFRKVAIADGVAPFVDEVFADPGSVGRAALLLGVVAFGVQIYNDFAGYTDIARGSARLLGVELVENFRQPYAAKSVTEFWRRWHISLSEWLRDYLYIPLGGNRGGTVRTFRNLAITMLLGGLWHGAAWTFVLWGGLHGTYLITERLLPSRAAPQARRSQWWVVPTFILVTAAWLPFRAGSWDDLVDYLSAFLRLGSGLLLARSDIIVLVFAVLATGLVDQMRAIGRVDPFGDWPSFARGLAYGSAAVLATVLSAGSVTTFIYFQF